MKVRLLTILTAISVLFGSTSVKAEDTYTLGIFPYLPPTKLQKLFVPIANDLAEKLGKKIVITSKSNYKDFRKELAQERYDIAFVQPFDYVKAHDQYNYKPLARRGKELRAIIIVRHDSALKKLADLKGLVVANPPKIAAVSHLTSMALLDIGINPNSDVERLYGKSHFSCMQNVLIGTAAACGTAGQALAHFEEKQMSQRFRVLHKTKPIAHSLFVAHTRVPVKDQEIIRDAILSWADNLTGQTILENGHFIPFVAAQNEDYDSVRNFWLEQDTHK